ncbi:MAG TPA: SCP2 sterol-binding domain-containing protein [Steroidobacteraceae bacterium]|jgi:ubiquinone biosynthesis protein UbiJ|nr:SCP2 sterol-binding domain-containing protein [Steroidobacteraceae bacterium]
MLTERIEAVLNRQVAASPRAGELLAGLAGRRLVVTLRHTPWQFALRSDGQALLLSRDAGGDSDAAISGSPLNLLALAGDSPEAVIRRGDVTIEGDAQIANQFRELGALLRPDVEEELSRLVGDVPAHQLGLVARASLSWLRQGARTAGSNLAEYLAHERRDLVPQAEAAEFLHGVDQLRETVDRLEARIAALPTDKLRP